MPVILIADNGSTQANATLQLRQLASRLSQQTAQSIHPVSLQHADKIDADKLNGIPAQTFHSFMRQQLSEGQREFILLPLFFGFSKALSKFIPDEVELLKNDFGEFQLTIADPVYPLPAGEPLLTDIVYEHIMTTSKKHSLPLKNLVLVDHGSPIARVTETRKHLAQTVQQKLPSDIQLDQAVMERRAGSEYDFNGDLLKDWLSQKASSGETEAIVIMMFFLAGRHAGESGDIIEICESVIKEHPHFTVKTSPLITEHELFYSILKKRLESVLQDN